MVGYLAAGVLPAIIFSIAVPLFIHLLSKKVSFRRSFPGIFFMKKLMQGQSRFNRLKDVLAVILRMLCLILCVLACAGMYWNTAVSTNNNASVIVILDASATMRQRSNGSVAFEEARGQCDQLLKKLGHRRCSLYIAGDKLESSNKVPGNNISKNRAMLSTARPSYGTGSLPQALALAQSVLKKNDDIYVVTDLTRHSLDGVDFKSLKKRFNVHIIPIGSGSGNIGLTNMSIRPGIGIIGQPITIGVTIQNYHNVNYKGSVAVRYGSEERLYRVNCAAMSSEIIQVELTPLQEEDLVIRAEIINPPEQDSIEEDNIRWGMLPVRPHIPATIVSDGELGNAHGGLLPIYAALSAANIDVDIVNSTAIEKAHRHNGLIVLVDLRGTFDASVINEHVSEGGTWLSIIQTNADAQFNNKIKALRSPIYLGERIDVSTQARGSIQFAEVDLDHQALKRFLGREMLLEEVDIYTYHLTPKEPDQEVSVLLTYGDGTIALAERRIDAGRFYVWNTAPAPGASNIASLDLFPLLMHSAAQSSIPIEKKSISINAGSPVHARISVINQHSQFSLPIMSETALITSPGVYLIDDEQSLSVSMPATETNTRQLEKTILEQIDVHQTEYGTFMSSSHQFPLWSWCIALAIFLLIVELFVTRSPKRLVGES